jgi:hypothetical protein
LIRSSKRTQLFKVPDNRVVLTPRLHDSKWVWGTSPDNFADAAWTNLDFAFNNIVRPHCEISKPSHSSTIGHERDV